jgi:putative ABC transport system permease protein
VVGLREIWRRKGQFALIVLIVTLIAYLVLMINGLGVGLNRLAGSALQNFNADAIAYSDTAGLSVIRSELSEDTIAEVRSQPDVRDAAPIGYLAASYEQKDGDTESVALMGFDPGTIAEPKVTDGEPLREGDDEAVLVDKLFLKYSGLEVGDTVAIDLRLNVREFRIAGEVDEGAFFFQPTAFMLRSTWRDLKYGDITDPPAASIILLKGDDLPGREYADVEVVGKGKAFANIEGVQGQQSTVISLRVFGYVIGALVIAAFFYVLTLQKVGQIGVLKAIGASSLFVFRQILTQVVIVSLIGLVISIPLAYITASALATAPDPVPVAFTTNTFVVTAAVFIATAVAGSLLSGRQVLQIDPIIALGQQQ